MQALILDNLDQDDGSDDGMDAGDLESILFFEITVGAKDQPRLLSKLSKALVCILSPKQSILQFNQ